RQRRVQVVEGGEPGRGHAMAVHELLGEPLAAFQARALGARAEDLVAVAPEGVGPAGHQRRLRADDDEVGALGVGDDPHAALVPRPADHAGRVLHAVVAGHDDDVAHRRRPVERPAQGVLAATRADHEDLQGVTSPLRTSLTASGYATCSSRSTRSASVASVSPGSTGTRRCTMTLPVSTPASTKCTLQPLSLTPSASAWRWACRPRCFGNRLARKRVV